ncbi:alpha/beta hydrolase [Pelagicoccus sp. NFK12]|uniref:Alpha/beta hydrolase n=1 Tax=Pelagicoccus enzymogenes TaxID=2773457 RepID=A0A927F8A1_9BACT|nr:alpha/beta hydrolase [Pelagicoccus enzymogenes]MBD5779704.1 alpha/beta hydrolase [Pelagicoccus enzymogenes]
MQHKIEAFSKDGDARVAASAMTATALASAAGSPFVARRSGKTDCGRVVFFIHGTPGTASDWEAVWRELAELGFDCERVALDRLGFGENAAGDSLEDWEGQLASFETVLQAEAQSERSLFIVGHSYGAALAAALAERLAVPGRLGGLVLVAGVLSPDEVQCRWYHRLLLIPYVSRLFPRHYVQSAKEMSAVTTYLAQLLRFWDRCKVPVTLLHGEEDRTIPFANSEYIASRLSGRNAKLVPVPGGGHALIQSHPKLIAKEIAALVAGDSVEKENKA